MHGEQAGRLPAPHDDLAALFRVVSRLRWRLGLERLLAFGIRGLIASDVAVIGLSLASWLAGWDGGVGQRMGLAAVPLLIGVALAAVRWPSGREAALAADRRLQLAERLATAVELAWRRAADQRGRFDRLQVQDAVARAAAALSGGWPALDRRAEREALLAAALTFAALGSLFAPGLPRPGLPWADQTTVQSEPAAAPVAATGQAPPAADPAAAELPATAQPPPQSTSKADPDLAARVQQEQAQRDALDKLAQGLGRVSATQPAADAIQRGDFSAAQQQLANVGEEADQLSDAAKQQLSKALQAAASATSGDHQLADRERQAAQALSRTSYTDQRQALHNLADQVQRSGERSVSADQLARDQGQLQHQQAAVQANGQSAGQASAAGAATGSRAAGNSSSAAQAGGQSPATGGAQGASDSGQQGSSGSARQGGPGIGTGADPQPLADQPSRLETSGERVTVPAVLGQGPGVRPPNGSEDQAGTDPTAGGQSVSELAQAQQTGQVATEQNLVPGEQRPVVRGYFR